MEARYLRVKNWEKFQHYHSRENAPHWIKLYPALLEDYTFRQLPELEQGRLLKVWLLAGKLRNRLPFDARYVAQVTGSKRVNLEMYVSLGWLEVIDEDGNLLSLEAEPRSTPTSRPGSMPEVEERREDIEQKEKEKSKAVDVVRPLPPRPGFHIPPKALKGAA